MIKSYDVGSMPFEDDYKKFLVECGKLEKYFEKKIVESFIDKILCGIDVPNYPQYRDMNEMFLEKFGGLIKTKDGYMLEKPLTVKYEKRKIEEVEVLKRNLGKISEKVGFKVKIKICVTGPHTLSWVFAYRDPEIFLQISDVLTRIVEENIFKVKNGEISILSLDEPLFGVVDDSRLDYGSTGRENLMKAWEKIFYTAFSKNVETVLHLHNTTDPLYWDIKSLKIIESHVEDPLYTSKYTRKMLEQTDKFLKASVTPTDFDKLIKQKIEKEYPQKENILQVIGEVWKEIKRGKLNPKIFLEDIKIIQLRLEHIIKMFGVERILYAGPECGLKSFPTYQCALECLKNVSDATKNLKSI